ncbi:endonuclease domain-containing protein [Gordonia sp. HY442]|uniref:endonuclease domain-containing protein n=1 Tax=Gordonia zhenghanii TaxID=2911516 RepID=UPI001F3D102B|nr:endonuclease domain-containing protein [Gordonia zhenghanii]MCF8606036.1 endonuclease domain-containing protein [Gordonia zhenghanii]
MPAYIRVAEHLAGHDGIITAARAYELGMSIDEVKHKVLVRLWIPHARGVYLSAEHRMTEMARLRIAVATHGGVVDRTAAAWLHGLINDLPDVITLSVPQAVHGTADCAVTTDSTRRTFPSEDIAAVAGIAVTALPLTILQAATELYIDIAVSVMDRALQIKRVAVTELRASLDRNSGAHGMRLARVVLTAAEDDSESEAERLFVRLLKRYAISGWEQQKWLGGHRIDFVWPELGIAVAINGWAFHHEYDRWDNDLRTTNMLVAMGWYPLSFPWKRLRFEEESVMRELANAIETRQTCQ